MMVTASLQSCDAYHGVDLITVNTANFVLRFLGQVGNAASDKREDRNSKSLLIEKRRKQDGSLLRYCHHELQKKNMFLILFLPLARLDK